VEKVSIPYHLEPAISFLFDTVRDKTLRNLTLSFIEIKTSMRPQSHPTSVCVSSLCKNRIYLARLLNPFQGLGTSGYSIKFMYYAYRSIAQQTYICDNHVVSFLVMDFSPKNAIVPTCIYRMELYKKS
jgi:hypothetical protein